MKKVKVEMKCNMDGTVWIYDFDDPYAQQFCPKCNGGNTTQLRIIQED